MASVPVTVIDAELLEPDVKLNPVVEPNVSVPCVTVSTSDSDVAVAAPSVKVIALLLAVEKTSDTFSLTPAIDGAVTVGLTERDTVAALLRPSRNRST